MKTILELYYDGKKVSSALLSISLYAVCLLLLRAKITNGIFLFFLIWNLFLAVVPYLIIRYAKTKLTFEKNKLQLFLVLFLWLLFLPNSFYIVTDFVHLSKSPDGLIWLDLVILSSFSISGFVLGILSLSDFEKVVSEKFTPKIINILILVICLLCGFGIYLGRVLRFNSWDILHNPNVLLKTVLIEITSAEVLLFTGNFGIFIYFFFRIRKFILNKN